MPDQNHSENDKKVAESEEVRRFYRALAIAHSNAIARVMEAPDEPDSIIAQAKVEFDRLKKTEEQLQSPAPKCKLNEIWDEKLQRCVLI